MATRKLGVTGNVVGAVERKQDVSQAIEILRINRTLLVQKLTTDPPSKPKVVENLGTPEAVFKQFKPEVSVKFENEQGVLVSENLAFSSLLDFGKKGIIEQSGFLRLLNAKKENLQKLMRELLSNKNLKKALEDPDTKAAFLSAIQAMMDELDRVPTLTPSTK